jgi:hypothetical protein
LPESDENTRPARAIHFNGLALFAANVVIFVVEDPQRMLDTSWVFSSLLPRYPSKIAPAGTQDKQRKKIEGA